MPKTITKSVTAVLSFSLPVLAIATDLPTVNVAVDPSASAMQAEMKGTKLGSNIVDLNAATALSRELQAGRANLPLEGALARNMRFGADGTVAVDFVASGDLDRLESDLLAIGASGISKAGHMISARLTMDELDQALTLATVQSARLASARLNAGIVTSQGDKALRANKARREFEVDGRGVRIGFLSDSFNCRFNPRTTAIEDQANNDLPQDIILLKDLGSCPGGSDEGRAMMQLSHDVAPGSAQAFHTAFDGQADFANGILRLRTEAGSDVIVDDVSYFAEPFFQDGVIAQAADAVVADGATYFSSAGNAARDSYEDGFRIAGFAPGLGVLHDFDSGPDVDFLQDFEVAPGDFVIYSFQWDEPHFQVTGNPAKSAQNDIDIFALNIPFCSGFDPFTGNFTPDVCQIPGFSNNILGFGGSGDPIEVWAIQNATGTPVNAEILIAIFDGPVYAGGPVPGLVKYIYFQDFGSFVAEYDTQSATSFGHSNAEHTSAVGASFWAFNEKTPIGEELGCNPWCLNAFSSAGGIDVLFDIAGNRLAEPDIRQTPDVVGPDGGNTTFFGGDIFFFPGQVPGEPDGFPNFFGTSASAPHVAAVAALLNNLARDEEVSPSPETIYRILEKSAKDFKQFGKGFDNESGFGFVDALKALERAEEVFDDLEDDDDDDDD